MDTDPVAAMVAGSSMATTHDLLPSPDSAGHGPDVHGPPPGTRCGLIAGADADNRELRVLGFGRCYGADIPPKHAAGTYSSSFRRRRQRVAFFLLDHSQETVWASECRWLDPAGYERYLETLRLGGFSVRHLTPSELREHLGRIPDGDTEFPD